MTVLNDPEAVQPAAVTVPVARRLLSLQSDWQVRHLIKNGKLRARNTGKSYIIPMSAIEEFLSGSDEPMSHPDSMRRSA